MLAKDAWSSRLQVADKSGALQQLPEELQACVQQLHELEQQAVQALEGAQRSSGKAAKLQV